MSEPPGDRATAARAAGRDWVHDLTYAILVGIMVASPAAAPPMKEWLLLATMPPTFLLWRVRMGRVAPPSALLSRRLNRISGALGAVTIGALVVSVIAEHGYDLPRISLIAAPIAAVAALALSRRWSKAHRAAMGAKG